MATSLFDIPVRRADGEVTTLADHAGKVMLIVNVASKCGFTKQYDGLEALYRSYKDQGFVVLGFPANDFGGQEPGTDTDIQDFCRLTYGVEFPVFAKITVKGPEKHALFRALIAAQPIASFKPGSKLVKGLTDHGSAPVPGEIAWNFEKFLVDRNGSVIARYGSDTPPEDEAIVSSIRNLLPI
jgi:glutathione peroxidase